MNYSKIFLTISLLSCMPFAQAMEQKQSKQQQDVTQEFKTPGVLAAEAREKKEQEEKQELGHIYNNYQKLPLDSQEHIESFLDPHTKEYFHNTPNFISGYALCRALAGNKSKLPGDKEEHLVGNQFPDALSIIGDYLIEEKKLRHPRLLLQLSDTQALLQGSQPSKAVVWDLQKQCVIKVLKIDFISDCRPIKITDDIIAVSMGDSIELWNIKSNQCVRKIAEGDYKDFSPEKMQLLSEERLLVLSTRGCYSRIEIWNTKSGERIHSHTGGMGFQDIFVTSPNAFFIVDNESQMRKFKADGTFSDEITLDPRKIFTKEELKINKYAFRTSNYQTLSSHENFAVVHSNSRIAIWDEVGNVQRLENPEAPKAGNDFDWGNRTTWIRGIGLRGNVLASATNNTIKLWNIRTGRIIKQYHYNNNSVGESYNFTVSLLPDHIIIDNRGNKNH